MNHALHPPTCHSSTRAATPDAAHEIAAARRHDERQRGPAPNAPNERRRHLVFTRHGPRERPVAHDERTQGGDARDALGQKGVGSTNRLQARAPPPLRSSISSFHLFAADAGLALTSRCSRFGLCSCSSEIDHNSEWPRVPRVADRSYSRSASILAFLASTPRWPRGRCVQCGRRVHLIRVPEIDPPRGGGRFVGGLRLVRQGRVDVRGASSAVVRTLPTRSARVLAARSPLCRVNPRSAGHHRFALETTTSSRRCIIPSTGPEFVVWGHERPSRHPWRRCT